MKRRQQSHPNNSFFVEAHEESNMLIHNVHRNNEKVATAIFLMVLAIVLFILAVTIAEGQTQSPERGFNPGKSYAISDIESISMQSGNLSMNMPLASLPPSRGGISAGLGLNYNSKLYDILTQSFAPEDPKYLQTLISSKDGGWRYNYKYRLDLEESVPGLCENVEPYEYYFRRLSLVLPDGSKHTLYIKDVTRSDGFMELDPDGEKWCAYSGTSAITSGPITYFTTDGTFLRLEMELDEDEDWENNAWTLYMPDGSKVHRYAPSSSPNPATNYTVQRITDRNGNYIDYIETEEDASYDDHQTVYIKDQLDRKIVLEYAAATNEDRIHTKGVAGEDVTMRVVWKSTTVQKSYSGCDIYPPATNCSSLTLNKTFGVVDKIYLPSQIESGSMYYDFDYNSDGGGNPSNGWGELSKVTLPSGAYAEYEYLRDGFNSLAASAVLKNRPTEKNLSYDLEYDGSTSSTTETWTYAATAATGGCDGDCIDYVTITGPNGAQTKEYYHYTFSWPLGTNGYLPNETWKTVNPDGSVTEKIYATNLPIAAGDYADPTVPGHLAAANRFVKYELTSIADNTGSPSKTAIKEYTQDKNGNTTQVKEYDFVSYSSIPRDGNGKPTGLPSGMSSYLKRITNTEFYNPTPDSASTTYTDADSYHLATSERLLRLAKSVEVQDGSASPKSRSEMSYDYTNYDSSNTKGGNVTETKVWDSFKGGTARSYSNPLTSTNSITTSATYNSYGMPETTTDANNVETRITYGNVTCPGGTVTDLYPTQTVIAYGTSIARTSTAVYDCYTGLTTSTTDEDNDLTNATEYDGLGRPTKTITADGDATWESWTITEYHDAERFVVVKSDLETKDDRKKVATQFYDQLGRVRLSKTLEDASTQSATNETDGIKVQTRYATTYSSPNGYTYQLTSNPYRAATSSAASSESTMGWTRSKAHHLGRHSEVETFSGSSLPAPWGSNTSSTGVVQTDIDANATTVTDQAGKLRRSITNGLGQLIRVDEPNSSNQLGTVASPNQKTDYAYDILNNLLTVTQAGSGTTQCGPSGGTCTQTRTFTYSSLSRLLSANNPESGTINYSYDPNGNLTTKTDARSITTTYTYDPLNRVTNRAYTNEPSGSETPDVDYFYGTTAPKVGKLVKVTNGTGADRSTTEYTSFDILGRVTGHKQTTDGNEYTTGYTYNLSGALIEQTYPSGRVVKNTLDADGGLGLVQSKKTSSDFYRPYASNFLYNAAGAVTAVRLGNGRWENTEFNSRLQPTKIGLGSGVSSQSLLKLEYSYGTTANNGNVVSQTITVPGVMHPFVQAYTYDELNRLSVAEETQNSSQTWKQTFSYDRYGNRNFVTTSGATTTLPSGFDPDIYNPTISTTNNRFSSGQGYSYDSSGNTTADAEGRTFVYDAENKQIEVIDGSTTIGQYFYDGDGKRVKKVVPGGETTVFVYDAGGKLIGEYSSIVQTGSNAKTVYTTNDHLGSPRINTDATGQVISRHDYHPFGEEIATSERTSGVGYTADTIRKKFTGYERDGETELDYANARMYASSRGKFTSPDPLLTSGQIDEPQSWNRFTFSLNSPLVYVDPQGLYVCRIGTGKGMMTQTECDMFEAGLQKARSRLADIENIYGKKSEKYKKAERALNVWGKQGVDNGVLVIKQNGPGSAQTATAGVTGTKTAANPTGQIIHAQFDEDYFDGSADNFGASIMHEGSHAADGSDWVKSGFSDAANPTDFQTEMDAYMLSSIYAEVQGRRSADVDVRFEWTIRKVTNKITLPVQYWNSSWAAADRETLRQNNIGTILRNHPLYSKNQNKKAFTRGSRF